MAVRTYSDLATIIAAIFADNTSGDISEQDLREFFTDLADSLAFEADIVDVAAAIETFRTASVTLTNKKIEKRVVTPAPGAAININKDVTDAVFLNEVNVNTTINNPLGAAPKNFEDLEFFIKDLGVSKTLTFGVAFGSMTDTLPANTPAGKWLYLKFVFNLTLNKYMLVNKQIQP